MVLELQGADRVGNALDRIFLAVGEVVGRVNHPLGARLVVRGLANAIQDRVAHIHIGRGHIDLRPQHLLAVGELPGLHARQQIAVFRHAAFAIRAVFTGFCERTAVFPRLLGVQVTDIGKPLVHQVQGPVVQLLEIRGGETHLAIPLVAQPAHVFLDGIDVLLALLFGVGVVEAQVAAPPKALREAKIHADRLGVSDMQIAVGLRWEAGNHGFHPAGGQVLGDDVLKEITGGGMFHNVSYRLWQKGAYYSHTEAALIAIAGGLPAYARFCAELSPGMFSCLRKVRIIARL